MNPIEQLMALLTGQGAPQQGGYVPAQDMGAHNMPVPQGMPTQRVSQAQPMTWSQGQDPASVNATARQGMKTAAQGAQGPGLLSQLFNPRGSKQTMTENWLIKSQGYDPGTAKVIAGNKALLGQVLAKQINGPDPMAPLELEKLRLEVEEKRNPSTDDIKEYRLAKKEGYKGTLTDFMRDMRKAGATNVTVGGGKYGTIPPGYELVEGPEGASMRPIPGGPVAQEMEATQKAAENKRAEAEKYGSVVTSDIDRAITQIEEADIPVTGMGSYLSAVPGTQARDLSATLDTVRANIGFDRLQKMRDASPTGGALGQVSEFENRLLQSTLGNIEQSQSKEQLLRNLRRIKEIYKAVINEGVSPELAQERGWLESSLTPESVQRWGKQNYGDKQKKRFRYNPSTGELE